MTGRMYNDKLMDGWSDDKKGQVKEGEHQKINQSGLVKQKIQECKLWSFKAFKEKCCRIDVEDG